MSIILAWLIWSFQLLIQLIDRFVKFSHRRYCVIPKMWLIENEIMTTDIQFIYFEYTFKLL